MDERVKQQKKNMILKQKAMDHKIKVNPQIQQENSFAWKTKYEVDYNDPENWKRQQKPIYIPYP